MTAAHERELVAVVRRGESGEVTAGGQRNRVLRWGPGVDYSGYSSGSVMGRDIPPELDAIAAHLAHRELMPHRPNAISVNEYQVGQGIDLHTDNDRSGDVIAILSLAGRAEMVFRRGKRFEDSVIVPLPPRTLVLMSGECRIYPWRHGILPVTELRYSVVFRHAAPAS